MKNISITAAFLAVTALCLSGGCSHKSSGNIIACGHIKGTYTYGD